MKRLELLDNRLWIEFAAMLMAVNGLYFYLVDGDGSRIFYAMSLLAGIWLLIVILETPLLFLKEHALELVFCGVCAVGIKQNFGVSDIYSWIRLVEVGVFLVALTTNPKCLTLDKGKQYFRLMARILVLITFVLMIGSFLLEILHVSGILDFERMNYFKNEVFGGLYGNGNRLAIHAFISIFLSLYLAQEKKNRFDLLNIVFQILGIILSGCRSVLLAGLVLAFINVGTILGYVKDAKKRRIARIGLIVICVAGVSGLVLATIFKSSIYFQHGFGKPDWWMDKLSGGRLNIWKEAYAVSKTSPIFGVGLNNIRAIAAKVLPESAVYNARGYENAHNMVINLLTYTGYVGLVCAALIFVKYLRIVVFVVRKEPGMRVLMMLLIGLLIIDQLDIVITFANYMGVYVFFLTLGLFALYARKMKEEGIHE